MSILGAVGSVLAAPTISKISSVPQNITTEGFGDATAKALTEVSDSQKLSGRLTKDFTLERTTASSAVVMIAGVKSNINFQTPLKTRNRLVQAYSDVMNMQIWSLVPQIPLFTVSVCKLAWVPVKPVVF